MPSTISSTELTQFQNTLANGNYLGFYSELESRGYSYASWAKGVAAGDTLAGAAAKEFLNGSAMMGVGGREGRELTSSEVETVKRDMADAYLNTLINIANLNNGHVDRDVNASEVYAFHKDVFEANNLGIENWTLYAPLPL